MEWLYTHSVVVGYLYLHVKIPSYNGVALQCNPRRGINELFLCSVVVHQKRVCCGRGWDVGCARSDHRDSLRPQSAWNVTHYQHGRTADWIRRLRISRWGEANGQTVIVIQTKCEEFGIINLLIDDFSLFFQTFKIPFLIVTWGLYSESMFA